MTDLILTNRKFSFKNAQSFETDLSGHHKLILKVTFIKSEPKQLNYRNFKNFYFESFTNDLLKTMVTCDRSYDELDKRFSKVLNKQNKHAPPPPPPKKKKWVYGNQKPHFDKNLRN